MEGEKNAFVLTAQWMKVLLFKKSNFSGLKDTSSKGHCAQLLHQGTVVAAILIKLSFKMAA